MVGDFIELSQVADLGFSTLFFLVFLYAVVKLIPNWIKVWQASQEAETKRKADEQAAMQQYYDDRNRTYSQQMEIMNRQAEQQSNLIGQATQVIARSNEVIAGNTDALRRNTEIHEKVQDCLTLDAEATRSIADELRNHDKRSQRIDTNIMRVIDKVDAITK